MAWAEKVLLFPEDTFNCENSLNVSHDIRKVTIVYIIEYFSLISFVMLYRNEFRNDTSMQSGLASP